MVIWSGWGFVIAVLAFASMIFTEWGVERLFGSSDYYQAHGWPKMLGLLTAAAVSFPLGRLMNQGAGRRHTLFFLPVQHWWVPLVGLSIIALWF